MTVDAKNSPCGCASEPRDGGVHTESLEQVARVAQALSDPIRLRMLELMTRGRGGCDIPGACTRGVPGPEPEGICVCEFQEQLGLAQSRVSYHARILRDAGLILTETRGRWSFYTVDRKAVHEALSGFQALLDS